MRIKVAQHLTVVLNSFPKYQKYAQKEFTNLDQTQKGWGSEILARLSTDRVWCFNFRVRFKMEVLRSNQSFQLNHSKRN